MDGIESKKFSKGIYYIDLKLSRNDFEADTMHFDTWDGIVCEGEKLNAVELDFVIKPTSNYFNIGNSLNTENVTFTPSTSGINEKEQIKRGDVRKLVISARPNYSQNISQLVDSMDIRLYVKDGMSEIDVISWDKVNKSFSENYYMIDTNILIPQRYYVDIRISYGMNSIVHHDVLSFDIVNDLDNRYA
jgi:Fe-S cluster assembly scaffold protein SufB